MATEDTESAVISLFFDDQIDRDEAIERVGHATVERAEQERELGEDDVEWGLSD